jgi:hypothetical protein
MFSELLAYIRTPCPSYVRHMDYLNEILAMKKRYLRNKASWQPHLDNTRRTVLLAAEKCANRRKTVVLGAGLLLDVPLAELSAMFQEVVLLDVVMLPEIREIAQRYGNVKLMQHDVTNVAQRLYENLLHGSLELPDPAPRVPEIDADTGLVVSLNILSQLWVIPRSFALKKQRGLDEEQLDEWCGRIVESHYHWLVSLSCERCIISDHEYVRRDREGRIISRSSTVYGLALPKTDAFWTWHIAPIAEDRQYFSKELKVGVWFNPAGNIIKK